MSKKGFTLVELLIVTSIIGLLLATSIVGYSRVLQNSRDTKRRLDISEIASAVENYRKDNGVYPTFQDLQNSSYLQSFPEDPLSSSQFTYEYSVNGDQSSYILYSKLELSDTYYIITPQGETTTETLVTPEPTQIPNSDPVFPTNEPTITSEPTQSRTRPTWYYE